ncbi:MAG: L-rhamnose isomerase [Defluviitaleaceae bacterium]|nr:L-rhamnose isomerase [Defluviitaleaceae bacterium]
MKAYKNIGVNVNAAMGTLAQIPISIHCWQGDDVTGFDYGGAALGGGIQATGNYPGKARTFEELTADFAMACSFIPGRKRINLHASYAVFEEGEIPDRGAVEYRHFKPWVTFAREQGIGIDFNPTCFGHEKVKDGLTLSSPDEATHRFWIDHCIRSRKIASEIGEALNDDVLCNLWIPDGYKNIPADRMSPRLRLKDSLDAIFAEPLPRVIDCVESKVFGIGLESYTVGSNEFYISYAAQKPSVYPLLDNGHFHPTEGTADKIAALLCFFDKLPLHITRPVRWDSDHVPLFDDEVREMCMEIVRNGAIDKVLIGLDFFDASVNRVAAWVVGTRNVQKALLYALLMPHDRLREAQEAGDFTALMVLIEEIKTLPFGEAWAAYCDRQGTARDGEWLAKVKSYEAAIIPQRRS